MVTPDIVGALNEIAAFLALDDFGPKGLDGLPADISKTPIDCAILAGNCVLETTEGAFRLLRSGICPRLLISGGIGHATEELRRKVASHPHYGSLNTQGRTEAHILADIAQTFWTIDPSRLLIEPESTNSGENARFSRALLERKGHTANRILLIQDPTMQRRTDATFRHVWKDLPTTFLNWPTFTPRLTVTDGELQFAVSGISGLWTMERFLALVMGEIPRLRDDEQGYGPRGREYIVHVDIPDRIEEAYARLQEVLAGRLMGRSMVPRPSLA